MKKPLSVRYKKAVELLRRMRGTVKNVFYNCPFCLSEKPTILNTHDKQCAFVEIAQFLREEK